MSYEDKTLSCRDCNEPFVFSAGEQEFFALKSLTNVPKRCPGCRTKNKFQRDGKDPASTTEVECAQCGIKTVVPFKPTGKRPVYCAPCMHKQKTAPEPG